MYYGTDKMAFLLNVHVLGQRFETNYVFAGGNGKQSDIY